MKKKIKIKINHHDHDNGRFQTHQPKWPSRPSGLISSSANLASKQVSKKSSALKKLKNNIDCHNKVCTAKGPRDRRVRLSAHTAIQFYDVQDRLRYGRPSEAIDWLMKEAKTAIDALHELPSSDDKKPEQDQHFNEEDPINSLMSFRSQSHGFYLSLLQSCQNPNWFNPQTLFSASASLDFEPTPTNWSNPQTLNQFLSLGGTLQSSYPPSIPNSMNLNYDQMPGTGGNLFTGDGFSGFLVSPRSRGEEEKEKENPVPNKPSSASATCLLHY